MRLKLLAILLMLTLLTGCAGSVFNQVKSGDNYSISADRLNTTLTTDYELNAGDAVRVSMTVRSGEFRVSIGSDGKALYEGNGVGLGDFTVNIPENGIYMIEVRGRNGSGNLSFSVLRAGNE